MKRILTHTAFLQIDKNELCIGAVEWDGGTQLITVTWK